MVRDLAWVMASPGLLASSRPEVISDRECATWIESARDKLLVLDRNPEPLLEWLKETRHSPLLGKYFESLLGFWIRHLLDAERFEAGIKLKRERETVGELDLVFQFPGEQSVRHWEASVKFYLCNANADSEALDPSLYIGTMTRDRLDRKTTKLFDQQLKQAQTQAAADALRSLGLAPPSESRALVKGSFFYPVDRDWRHHPFPVQVVSPEHGRGWWSRGFPFDAFSEGSHWIVLKRHRWLSPFRESALGPWSPLTHVGMREFARGHFEEHRYALMLARVGCEGDAWVELDRGVVTHTGWPGM